MSVLKTMAQYYFQGATRFENAVDAALIACILIVIVLLVKQPEGL